MHVVFVANCDHKALSRSRSLLDRFANRIGDRAWASLITQAALDEVQQALKRKATRQTSVACYRSDTKLGLRLIWVVGNRGSYDSAGRFAVATRRKARERPLAYRHAALVAELAGYAHDLGKASAAFQQKLYNSCVANGAAPVPDAVRHEWLSAVLLRALMERDLSPATLDEAWLELKTTAPKALEDTTPPVACSGMKSAADAALWAVLTHHGATGCNGLDGALTNAAHVRSSSADTLSHFLRCARPAAHCDDDDSARWADLLARINKLLTRLAGIDRSSAYWEGVLLAARAAVIVADHKVSSLPYTPKQGDPVLPVIESAFFATKTVARSKGKPAPAISNAQALAAALPLLYANTKYKDRKPEKDALGKAKLASRALDQPLSWHLREVGELAQRCVRMIGADDLPVVGADLVSGVLDSRASADATFAWQDKAADSVAGFKGGQLVFNVASTGSGKTLANLKIALAARPKSARLAVAFNLRSLTQQTFEAYGEHLSSIDKRSFERDFACLMGERMGFDPSKNAVGADLDNQDEDSVGAEGEIDLRAADTLIVPEWLQNIAPDHGSQSKSKTNLQKLIAAPVLVSTADWIIAAGEPGQQARHAKALMRLSSSDLVLDEVDSYDAKATVALARLVQTASSFGRNVVVSSATLNPQLADLLVHAYAAGHRVAKEMLDLSNWRMSIVSDGFDPVRIDNPDAHSAMETYCGTMRKMADALASAKVTKRFLIAAPDFRASEPIDQVAQTVISQAMQMHAAHGYALQCLPNGPKLSMGLVRVANVSTCQDLAERLRACGDFVVCAYHARDTQWRRNYKEENLDRILNRKSANWVEALLAVCPWLKHTERRDVRLIVVATPVEEVGRDHDFDYAIIEPSSMHSIVQTAGRVNRHRREACATANVAILSRNMRALRNQAKNTTGRVFFWPGLEVEDRESANASTHSDVDMGTMLAAEGDALDASLVFGSKRKTAFARCDERAIELQTQLARGIIERDPGDGADKASLEMHFITREYAQKFPLRDHDKPIDFMIKDGMLYFLGQRVHGLDWIETCTVKLPPRPESGVWLCATEEAASPMYFQLPGYVAAKVFGGRPVTLDWHGLRVGGCASSAWQRLG